MPRTGPAVLAEIAQALVVKSLFGGSIFLERFELASLLAC
jgi:hypothetical protein